MTATRNLASRVGVAVLTLICVIAGHAQQPAQGDASRDASQQVSKARTAQPTAATETRAVAVTYARYCSVCHGDRGDGNSRARGSMMPPPRDFTSAESARALTRDRMVASVRDGRPGTAMAAWGSQLDAARIERLVDYIRESFMAPTRSADEGGRIYARTCSVCHGDNGQGAVWASTSLRTRPRDFTSASSRQALSRGRMVRSVTHGRPDTAMPGFETQLSANQIAAVVDYIRHRFMGDTGKPRAPSETAHSGHAVEAAHGDAYPHGLVGDAQRGAALYRINCVACHGEQGDGQGPRAYFILPKPRDFTHPAARAALNRAHLFQAVSMGTVRTEMPAWSKVLDSQAIADVSEYVYRHFLHVDDTRPSN